MSEQHDTYVVGDEQDLYVKRKKVFRRKYQDDLTISESCLFGCCLACIMVYPGLAGTVNRRFYLICQLENFIYLV